MVTVEDCSALERTGKRHYSEPCEILPTEPLQIKTVAVVPAIASPDQQCGLLGDPRRDSTRYALQISTVGKGHLQSADADSFGRPDHRLHGLT
jgi:hypothetical protein